MPRAASTAPAGVILVGNGTERYKVVAAELVDRALVTVQLAEGELEVIAHRGKRRAPMR
jgi:hypothetical protein